MRTFIFSCLTILSFSVGAIAQNTAKAEMLCNDAMDFLFENEPITKEVVTKAISMYEDALKADQSYAIAYEQLAIEFWSIGKSKEAYQALSRGEQFAPENKAMFVFLTGLLMESEGKIPEATEAYKKSISLFEDSKPKNKSIFTAFYRSLAYYLTDNVDIAIDKYKEAINSGGYLQEEIEEFYDMQLELLETMDLMEYIEHSITNKYGLRAS